MFNNIQDNIRRAEISLFWYIFAFGIFCWAVAFWKISTANASGDGIVRIAQVEDSIIFKVRWRGVVCFVIPQTPGTDTAFPVYAPAISCVRR